MAGAQNATLSVSESTDEAVCEYDLLGANEEDYVVELWDESVGQMIDNMALDSQNGDHRVYSLSGFGATQGTAYRVDIYTKATTKVGVQVNGGA